MMYKSPLFLDCETTKKPLHDPFNPMAKLIYVGVYDGAVYADFDIEYSGNPYGEKLNTVQGRVRQSDILVGANLKFDLHWLRRYGIAFSDKLVWDVLLAQFILNHQTTPFTSLNDVYAQWGMPPKLDVVKTEYWDRRCSCCAGIVTKILNIGLKDCATSATTDSTKLLTEPTEQPKEEGGEQRIQRAKKLLGNGDLKNYVLVLRQRLEQNEPKLRAHTKSQTLSMLDSWLLQYAQSVEELSAWSLTTTTKREQLEGACVELVMQLWDTLKNESGWSMHSSTCAPIPLDTTDVPEDILRAYLKQDVIPMQEVFDKQYAAAEEQGMLPLILLHCQDLLMLEEMEWNGNKYDIAGSRKEAARVLRETRTDTRKLNALAPHKINWGSPDAISLVLYGGTYKYKERETYTFTYKDGSTKEKEHWVVKEMEFPRIVPPPKTARAKEGFWPTDEATLKKLRATGAGKKIVSLLLDLRIKEKLVGTYLKGFPSKYKEAQWEDELLHTNYNQGVAVTGRLSSDKPNVQNNPPVQKKFFISRFY